MVFFPLLCMIKKNGIKAFFIYIAFDSSKKTRYIMYNIDFSKPLHVHFIGIGGISMSGLAQILLANGFRISGSDNQNSALTEELQRLGANIRIGQSAANITEGIDLVVYTAAIKEDNPEFQKCLESEIPMMSRAELLGQIMKNYNHAIAISGTHGKTTTSSMSSEILIAAGTDPTLTIGGILKSIRIDRKSVV